MKKLAGLFILSILLLNSIYGQKNLKWGKIPEADLKMTVYEADPEAEAVILANVGSAIYDLYSGNFEMIYAKHKRIKILKRSGFEYGDVSFIFSSGNNTEKLLSLKAQVIAPDGEVTKLLKSELFKTKMDDYHTKVSFSFPNIKEGSIIEWKYEILSRGGIIIDPWYFQDKIPTRYSEYTVAHPKAYNYLYDLRHGDRIHVGDEKNYSSSGFINVKYFTGLIVKEDMVRVTQEMTKRKYHATDMPAFKKEPYVPTQFDYIPRVSLQLASTNVQGVYRNILSDWSTVGKWFYESDFQGKRISAPIPRDFEVELAVLCARLSKEEKIETIHDYLVKNIKWDGRFTKYAGRKVKDIINEGEANSSELSFLFLALLKKQGIKAYPALVSTRDHGKVNTSLPFLSQFNHVMVYIPMEEEEYLLIDAIDDTGYSLPSLQSQNYTALVLLGKVLYKFLNVDAPKSKYVLSLETKLNENEIEGQLKFNYYDYYADEERSEIKDLSKLEQQNHFLELFEEDFVNLIDFQLEDDSENKSELKGIVKFTSPVEQAGDLIYLNPFLGIAKTQSPFPQENRELPIDLPYKMGQTILLDFEIPEGYTIESLPKMIKITLEDGDGLYQFLTVKKGNSIQLISRLNLKKTFFLPTEYEYLKQFFDKIAEKHAEPIVLRKN